MSKPPKKIHRVVVEQAVAFGRSPDWMVEHLDATDMEIDAALRWIDQCHREDADGLPPVPCGTTQGFNRHKLRGEPVCPRCRYADAEHQRKRRAMKKRQFPAGDLTRPVDTYYGAAAPGVIADLLDALNGAA